MDPRALFNSPPPLTRRLTMQVSTTPEELPLLDEFPAFEDVYSMLLDRLPTYTTIILWQLRDYIRAHLSGEDRVPHVIPLLSKSEVDGMDNLEASYTLRDILFCIVDDFDMEDEEDKATLRRIATHVGTVLHMLI